MLLHLGKDTIISLKNIIAIIDKESAFTSEITQNFFERARKEGKIEEITDDIKTYILTDKIVREDESGKKTKKSVIYTSNISAVTLKKRAGFVESMINV